MSEPVIGWIREVVLDGPDPWGLARFWAGLLGGTPVEWYPGWVTLEPPPNGQRLSFQETATPLAADTSRVHFDILVADLASAHDRVIEAGATPAGEHVSPRPVISSAWSFASDTGQVDPRGQRRFLQTGRPFSR